MTLKKLKNNIIFKKKFHILTKKFLKGAKKKHKARVGLIKKFSKKSTQKLAIFQKIIIIIIVIIKHKKNIELVLLCV